MRIVTIVTTLLLIVFGYIPAALATDKTVIVSGSSELSFEDAIRQAQRQAVEEGVGVFIQSQTEMQNFVLQKDKIISRTNGYITNYSVLEKSETNKIFTLKIQATVSLDKIKDDLVAMRILLESMERPKLMVLISEDYKSMDNLGMTIAGTELAAQLQKKGFELVDKTQMEAVKNVDQQQQALAGNAAAAASLGLHFGAQYVIVGKAVAQDAGEAYPGSGIRSIQASLQLQVIQSQTASILGSTVQNGIAAHLSPLSGATKALQGAVSKAVDAYLVNTITNSFQEYLNNGTPLKLQISGVQTFSQYKAVSDDIEAVKRVMSSKNEGWNKAGGLVMLDLRFKGTSEELASLLDGRNLGNNKLVVVDFAPERVNCTLK